MKHVITSVNGNYETKDVRDFVGNYMLAKDSRALREYIKEVQPDIDLNVTLDSGEEIIFTTPRNRFYNQNHYSMLRTVFNRDQGSVKRFKTINYEGSQAKIIPNGIINNPIQGNRFELEGTALGLKYLDDFEKQGWYVSEIKTDLQKGSVKEFIDKENKWFDYIRGEQGNQVGDELDTGNFSLQGIGMFNGGPANLPTNYQ